MLPIVGETRKCGTVAIIVAILLYIHRDKCGDKERSSSVVVLAVFNYYLT